MTLEKLSDAELDIMRVLWESECPLKASEITKALSPKHSWKVPTVHVMVSRLTDKGFIAADKSSYSHYFSPAVSEKEYLASESKQLLSKAQGKLPVMIAALLDSAKVTDTELSELSSILDAKLREIEQKKAEK